MSRKNPANRVKSESATDPKLTRMPGPASGVEALGFTASLVILAVVVFYFAHRFGIVHRAVFPLHFPVLLGGMILSPIYAAVVGVMAPAVLSGLTGFPTAGQAILYMVELAVCGAATSLTVSTLIRQTQSTNWIGWMLRGVIGVLVGLTAAFVGYILVSIIDVGYSGISYFMNSFFVSKIYTYLFVIAAVPVLGLTLRRTAHH